MSYVRCLPVEMVMDLERLPRDMLHGQLYDPRRRDLWRFGALLALDIGDPVDRTHIVNLGEGGTLLLDYEHHPVAKLAGFRLGLKEEGKAHAGSSAATCLA